MPARLGTTKHEKMIANTGISSCRLLGGAFFHVKCCRFGEEATGETLESERFFFTGAKRRRLAGAAAATSVAARNSTTLPPARQPCPEVDILLIIRIGKETMK